MARCQFSIIPLSISIKCNVCPAKPLVRETACYPDCLYLICIGGVNDGLNPTRRKRMGAEAKRKNGSQSEPNGSKYLRRAEGGDGVTGEERPEPDEP